MPKYTFQGPDGQKHTIEGPEGSSPEDAFKILQQHLGGEGRPAASAQPQPQQGGQGDYHSKLSSALDTAMKALLPSWEHNKSSYSPYKPAQPGNMPNDAINPVGNDAQLATALGAAGAASLAPRLAAGAAQAAPRAATPPPALPVNMSQLPTQASFGTQMAQNVGQAPMASLGAGAANTIPAAGNALQAELLKAGLQHGATSLGHAIGGPIGGLAAKFVPKMLGF